MPNDPPELPIAGPQLPLDSSIFVSLLETDAPAMILESNRILAANAAAARLLGVQVGGDLRGVELELLACDDSDACRNAHRDPRAECWHTFDDRKIDVATTRFPIGDRDQKLSLATMSDVTENRRTKEALFEADAHLRESQRLAQIGHWTLDLQTGVLEWSDEVYRFFEFDRASFAASYDAFLARVHPQDRQTVDESYRASVERRTAYDVTHRVLMPDGRVKHARERGRTFYGADGRPMRSIGTVQDVTTEVEREEQLRTAEHALDSSCAAVVFANLEGVVRSANPAFFQLWQLNTPATPTGRSLAEFFADSEAAGRILAELEQASSSVGMIAARRDDGTTFIAEYVASITRTPTGRPLGMLIHFLDVTERIRSEQSLRESRERLRLVFDNSSDVIVLLRQDEDRFVIEMANERMLAAIRQIASDDQEYVRLADDWTSFVDAFVAPPGVAMPLTRALEAATTERRSVRTRATLAVSNRLFDCTFVPVLDASDRVGRVLVTLHDITAETLAETTLSSTQALLLEAERLANIGSWQRDLRTRVSRWSPGMYRLLGFEAGTAPPTDEEIFARIHEDDQEQARENVTRNLSGEPVGHFEWRVVLPDEELRIIRGAAHGVCDVLGNVTGIVGFLQDITEQREAAERIRAQLDEKEVLLREIHHRVKNNLQIISSLLYLQSQEIADSRIAPALEATRGRISAMALVHEKLYSADDLGSVDMGLYARELGLSLFAVFGIDPTRVALRVAEGAFSIELDRAIPCGLIINELLTNALKHAFPEGRRGAIDIRFPSDHERLVIEVADDGVGIAPSPADTAPPRGLGLKLLPRLAAQLGGSLVRTSASGTHNRLVFPRTR